ncbi:MAG: hypothetical protein EPN58_05690 [Rhodanobacter sp.]|nr:MAG: hypothetical protein EPN58_05690 [Rhodanobacter sp.]
MAKLLRNLSHMSSAGAGAAIVEVVGAGCTMVDVAAEAAGASGGCEGTLAQAANKADRVSGTTRRRALFMR